MPAAYRYRVCRHRWRRHHRPLDLDSDNDGISDLLESGQNAATVDTNNDGIVDGAVDASGIPTAANGGAGVTPVDTDSDGTADYLDLDSDNDGIADAVEARPTAGFTSITSTADSDGDGVINSSTASLDFGGSFVTPVNTDGSFTTGSDTIFDFRDTNSDGDARTRFCRKRPDARCRRQRRRHR